MVAVDHVQQTIEMIEDTSEKAWRPGAVCRGAFGSVLDLWSASQLFADMIFDRFRNCANVFEVHIRLDPASVDQVGQVVILGLVAWIRIVVDGREIKWLALVPSGASEDIVHRVESFVNGFASVLLSAGVDVLADIDVDRNGIVRRIKAANVVHQQSDISELVAGVVALVQKRLDLVNQVLGFIELVGFVSGILAAVAKGEPVERSSEFLKAR